MERLNTPNVGNNDDGFQVRVLSLVLFCCDACWCLMKMNVASTRRFQYSTLKVQ